MAGLLLLKISQKSYISIQCLLSPSQTLFAFWNMESPRPFLLFFFLITRPPRPTTSGESYTIGANEDGALLVQQTTAV
jgi:hypothetical protein